MALLSAYVLLSEGRFVSQQIYLLLASTFESKILLVIRFNSAFMIPVAKLPPLKIFCPRKVHVFKSFDEILCSTLRKNHKFCSGGSENRSILDLIWPFGSATDQDLSRWAQVSFVAKSSENEFPMSECRNFSLHPCSGALPGSHKGQNYLQVEDV